jgi:hypothetical protein
MNPPESLRRKGITRAVSNLPAGGSIALPPGLIFHTFKDELMASRFVRRSGPTLKDADPLPPKPAAIPEAERAALDEALETIGRILGGGGR